ncbi:DUF6259 domain-containing protein [Cohnella abietis]|uniref:DUF6259 domain-containing protein n=1 Tax=Cohnella abietis TaxID=2507935 RepID=A0A3T1D0M5_9BACL|nr:DUF6259 domain-containing protein [Cohnella abietis]BBI31559.1 hypothetical protein KCTCHS21_09580 [Cohnella abietis]
MKREEWVWLKGKTLQLGFNPANYSLRWFGNEERSWIVTNDLRDLLLVRLRNAAGEALNLGSSSASKIEVEARNANGTPEMTIHFLEWGGTAFSLSLNITIPDESELSYWNVSLTNGTGLVLEWIDLPNVTVPNDLVAKGGEARIVWPGVEGVLVEDASLRENGWVAYRDPGYPSKGWEGIYPAAAGTQFMAYYKADGGLYYGTHDAEHHVKSIEYMATDLGVRLQFRIFPGIGAKESYELGFPIVLGSFAGDWYGAADIYRNWLNTRDNNRLTRLVDNKTLPEWFNSSPVTVTYPVRGTHDVGNMDPNLYYPYVNALPYLERLKEEFQSPIMALLMHWEGTAPWAPPYVWPPYGGADALRAFSDSLHEKGMYLGLYCSGTGWTQESLLDPAYTMHQEFTEQQLEKVMCTAPDGSLPYSLICNGYQRWGYDMCAAHPFTSDTIVTEIRKILASDCDYIQFFDQNLGGLSYFCYSHDHGHVPVPGKWQVDAMLQIGERINTMLQEEAPHVLFGCETAAAEPFMSQFQFNDLRYSIAFFAGQPIPIYQYLYHEYINNFMGNQNNLKETMDLTGSPWNLLWRTAYAFHSGDMMTVVLGDEGKVHWDWCTEWDVPGPDQSHILRLISQLNPWRTGTGQPYLVYGRMLRSLKTTCEGEVVDIVMKAGHKLRIPPVITSRWTSDAGGEAQFLINYTPEVQTVTVELEEFAGYSWTDSHTADATRHAVTGSVIRLTIQPLSAVMLERNQ